MTVQLKSYKSNDIDKVSIVVPVFNEQDNICELVREIIVAMSAGGMSYELIIVDDGSTDDTVEVLRRNITKSDAAQACIKVIELRRNFGQTAAMAAGFDLATGDVIVPMDGDLQNDPADIPSLVAKLAQGYDVVSGWRRRRKDRLFSRKIPSFIANYVIGLITGVKLHDYGCSMKAYHKDVIRNLNLYGEMHRFIPAIASWSGARVTEMEVNHRPRLRGTSKYGLNRTIKVILDLATVKFLGSFSTRPLHIFGGIGVLALLASFVTAGIMIYQKFFAGSSLSMNKNPLLTLTAMLMMMSVQFLLMGLLAEMLCRTYHESQNKATYIVRRIIELAPANSKDNDNG